MEKIVQSGRLQITKHSIETPYPVGDVHVYTCILDGKHVMFDTGPPTKEALRYLKENVDLDRLEYLFITHCHPDHYGQAKFLESAGAKVVLSKYDTFKYERVNECADIMAGVVGELGFPKSAIDVARESFKEFHSALPYPSNYRLLEESEGLLDNLGLRYIRCPGHTQSDIVFLMDDYAVSGDVILREIFTAPLLEVDFDTFEGRFSNYRAYCSTISKLKGIEGMTFLPSHRDYIDSVDERIVFFVTKLIERSSSITPMFKEGKSVYDTAVSLFGERMKGNPMITYIKMSEIVFMHDFLESPGLLVDALKDNGIYGTVEPLFAKIVS